MPNIFSVTENINSGIDIALFAILLIFTVAVSIALIWIASATMHKENKGNGPITLFSVTLVIGIIIRILLAIFIKGNRDAYSQMIGSSSDTAHLMAFGTTELYADGVNTYPISLYIIYIFAKIGSALGFSANSIGMQVMVKLPLIISDVITAILLYKLLSKFSQKFSAAALSGFFMLTPVSFIASAIWPTDIAFLLPLLVLSFYFMAVKKYFGMFAAYSAALLVSKDALYLYPVFAVYCVLAFIRACKFMRKQPKRSFKEIFADEETSPVIKVPLYFVSFLLISYVVCLPLSVGAIKANFFKWIYMIYLQPLADITFYSNNGLSIYNIFGRNFGISGVGFDTKMAVWFVVACAVIITVLIVALYWSKKNRANLICISAFVLTTIFLYFVGFAAMDMLLVFPILLFAFALIKDKRLLTVILVLSLAFVLNAAGVLAYNGEFNNSLSPVMMSSKTFLNVVNIIASILSVLTHLYLILVTLDICSGQRKTFANTESMSLGKNLKNWLAR